MKNSVSVTQQRHIAAPRADVWAVIADPHRQEQVEPRCRLQSTSGDWRFANSEFTVVVRGVHLRYHVVTAEPSALWIAAVSRGSKQVAIQSGELHDDGSGTLARWTVTLPASPLTARLQRWFCERELTRWLSAVEREAQAMTHEA